MEKQRPPDASDPSGPWSGFLIRLNQYKELIVVIMFFLGGLFWLYSFFATKEQLQELKCLTNINISIIEARMERKFFWDELTEKAAEVQWLVKKEILSQNEEIRLMKNRAQIELLKNNLNTANAKYRSAYQDLTNDICNAEQNIQ